MARLLVSSLLAAPAAKGHGPKLIAREKRNDDGGGANQEIFHHQTLCGCALSPIGSETTQWRRACFGHAEESSGDGADKKLPARGGRMPAATDDLMAIAAVGVKSIGPPAKVTRLKANATTLRKGRFGNYSDSSSVTARVWFDRSSHSTIGDVTDARAAKSGPDNVVNPSCKSSREGLPNAMIARARVSSSTAPCTITRNPSALTACSY